VKLRGIAALLIAFVTIGAATRDASAAALGYYAGSVQPTGPACWWAGGSGIPLTATGEQCSAITTYAPHGGDGTIAGPFPTDPDHPLGRGCGAGCAANAPTWTYGSGAPRALSFWLRPGPEADTMANTGTLHVWGSDLVYTDGCNCVIDQPGGLYLNTPDGFGTLCWGQVGGGGHCSAFGSAARLQWSMLTLYYDGAGNLSLWYGDVRQHSVGGITAWTHSSDDFGWATRFATSTWDAGFYGIGDWTGAAATALMPGCASSTAGLCAGGTLGLVWVNSGGELPQIAPPEGGGPGSSAGTGSLNGQCQTAGFLSGKCKYQLHPIDLIPLSDCSGYSLSITDVGGDVQWLTCNLGNVAKAIGNVGIAALNALILAANVVIDLVLPADNALDPLRAFQADLDTRAPFSYLLDAAAVLPHVFDGGSASPDLSLTFMGHSVPVHLALVLAYVQPYRSLLVALLYVSTAFIVWRSVRRSFDA
jgi:hypothetical protein